MNIVDGLKSLIGNMGNPNRDKAASVVFHENDITDDQLNAAYSSNWIARKIVDIPARDALRKWRTWNTDYQPEIEEEERRLDVRARVLEACIKARLLGGAAIYIGTDQEPSEPLDVERIKQGGILYLTVLTRREITANDLEQDPMTPYYGRPKSYTLSSSVNQVTIHPSRLIIFYGDEVADTWHSSGTTMGWGESVLKATADSIKQAGGTFANVASLIFEANVDVIGVPDLLTNLSQKGYEERLLQRFGLAAAGKGINGTLIMDSLETYERRHANFANLHELMEGFAIMCASAADIPVTRFLGRSPGGMNSTGDSDLSNYHDKLQSAQTLEIGPAMYLLDKCLVRSALGNYPEEISYDWTPLKQMNEQQIADIGKQTADYLKVLSELNVFTGTELREIAIHKMTEVKALRHLESFEDERHVIGKIDAQVLTAIANAATTNRLPKDAVVQYVMNTGLYHGQSIEQVMTEIELANEAEESTMVGLDE